IVIGVRRMLGRDGAVGDDEAEAPPTSNRKVFAQGALVNVLNPKTALFFLAFLPQFVDPDLGSVGLQAAVLGTVFVAMAVVSDCTYALAASALAGRIGRSERAKRMRRLVSGGLFVALGATAATAKRAPWAGPGPVPRIPLLSGPRIVSAEVPADGVVLRPPPPSGNVIRDVGAAVVEALRFPLAGPPLASLVRPGGSATLVIEQPTLP